MRFYLVYAKGDKLDIRYLMPYEDAPLTSERWCIVKAETVNRARAIAMSSRNLGGYDYTEIYACLVPEKSWIHAEYKDQTKPDEWMTRWEAENFRKGIVLDIEFDAYEKQIEYDYASHYG